MELTNEFSLSVPVDAAWAVLTDLERVAPCMPGFQLQEVDGDEYRGIVKVKVGPVTAQYRGVASFQERDEGSHRAIVRAEGKETRGQGNASATVTATLAPEDGGTRVTMHTDLTITGRVAQFGRGVIADVSRKLLREFVRTLEADVLEGAASEGAGASAAPTRDAPRDAQHEPGGAPATGTPRQIQSPRAEPVDLVATAGVSVLKRLVPVLVLIGIAIWLLLRR